MEKIFNLQQMNNWHYGIIIQLLAKAQEIDEKPYRYSENQT